MQDVFKALREMLIRDEGLRLKPYRDTVGKLTIGVGRNLEDVGISAEEADLLLHNDIQHAAKALDQQLLAWRQLNVARQQVLLNMLSARCDPLSRAVGKSPTDSGAKQAPFRLLSKLRLLSDFIVESLAAMLTYPQYAALLASHSSRTRTKVLQQVYVLLHYGVNKTFWPVIVALA